MNGRYKKRPVRPNQRSLTQPADLLSGVEFRVAKLTDWPELMTLIRAYYRYDDIRFTASIVGPALKKLLANQSIGRVWIARDGTAAVGYAILTFNYDLEFGGLEGIVTDLFIHPSYRGRRLGRRAMELVDAYCRSKGISAVELQVERENRAAQTFYRRLGFKQLSRLVMSRDVE